MQKIEWGDDTTRMSLPCKFVNQLFDKNKIRTAEFIRIHMCNNTDILEHSKAQLNQLSIQKDVVFAREFFSQLLEGYTKDSKLQDYEFLQRNNTEIRKENERLKKQLNFVSDYEYRTIVSQIIGRNPDSLYSGITINKGSNQGIHKGMPVIAIQDGNVGVVGRIVTVGVGTSIVMPVYDSQCNISARIQNTRDIGIVSGNGSEDLPLSMQYIRKRAQNDFSFGDIVVTSGENDNYMRDIPIGTISSVKALDYDSSLSIELDTIIDFSRLEIVLVVDQSVTNEK